MYIDFNFWLLRWLKPSLCHLMYLTTFRIQSLIVLFEEACKNFRKCSSNVKWSRGTAIKVNFISLIHTWRENEFSEIFYFSLYWGIFTRSPPEVFLRKGVLRISSKFTGEHPCQSAILIMLQGNFIEIALRHGCSPVNLLDIFRTPFPKHSPGGLLLNIMSSSRPE